MGRENQLLETAEWRLLGFAGTWIAWQGKHDFRAGKIFFGTLKGRLRLGRMFFCGVYCSDSPEKNDFLGARSFLPKLESGDRWDLLLGGVPEKIIFGSGKSFFLKLEIGDCCRARTGIFAGNSSFAVCTAA